MYDCCCQEFKWLALTQFFIYPLIHPLFTPCSPLVHPLFTLLQRPGP